LVSASQAATSLAVAKSRGHQTTGLLAGVPYPAVSAAAMSSILG
jgi:hypothetical protein